MCNDLNWLTLKQPAVIESKKVNNDVSTEHSQYPAVDKERLIRPTGHPRVFNRPTIWEKESKDKVDLL